MPAFDVDGNDVCAVDEIASTLIEKIRNGHGPHFLHARTYRIKGHISRDKMLYRPEGETEAHLVNEPLLKCKDWMIKNGIKQKEIDDISSMAYEQIKEALEAAKNAPFPDKTLTYTDVQDLGNPYLGGSS